jgi:hypothetical protein
MPSLSSANIGELVLGGISFLLTLMTLSYLIGDNPAFRVAIYIFIGVSAGYVAAVAWHQVLYPRLFLSLRTGIFTDPFLPIVPLVMGLLLLLKISPRTASLGTPPMAFMVGVGAAVAIGGAVMGTLIRQSMDSMNALNLQTAGVDRLEKLGEGLVMLLGTITTLIYFHFGAKATTSGPQRGKLINLLGWVGQVFIAITFGVLFAGVFVASMTALIERLNFIINFIF